MWKRKREQRPCGRQPHLLTEFNYNPLKSDLSPLPKNRCINSTIGDPISKFNVIHPFGRSTGLLSTWKAFWTLSGECRSGKTTAGRLRGRQRQRTRQRRWPEARVGAARAPSRRWRDCCCRRGEDWSSIPPINYIFHVSLTSFCCFFLGIFKLNWDLGIWLFR